MSTAPIYSAIVAAIAVFMIGALGIRVSLLRLKHKVWSGDGGHKDLLLAIRTHANALEHLVPLIILLALFELVGAPKGYVAGVGAVVLFARVGHATGYVFRLHRLRRVAATLTYAVEVVLPVWLMVLAVRAL